MNQYLIYVNDDKTALEPRLLPWQNNLFSRGIVVLPVRTLADAIRTCKVYNALMILLQIPQLEPVIDEISQSLAAWDAAEGFRPPVVGLMPSRPGPEDLARLAQAGVADLIDGNDPESFILWRLDLLHRLNELKRFEQGRMDVAELSRQTRIYLHDLSQPLSAVQGRLQLIATKCPPDDPNAAMFHELVRLAFEITHQLMQIQQLHRQFS